MSTSINFHRVVELTINPPRRSSSRDYWVRDLKARDAEGHVLDITFYADTEERLADASADARLALAYAQGRADQAAEALKQYVKVYGEPA